MWRKIRILSAFQAYVVSSCSAAVLSFPFVYLAWQRNQDFRTPLLGPRDPGLPIEAGLLLILGFIPPLLGYYHVGRIGALVGMATGIAMFYGIAIARVVLFTPFVDFGMIPTAFVAVATVVTLGMYGLANVKLAQSRQVVEAQRKLGLSQSNKNLTTVH